MNAERRLLFRNARLLDPESGLDAKGNLMVVGDKIWAVGDDVPEQGGDGIEVVDCRGACLAPGFVDMHVFLREPMKTTGLAAAAGGVTSIALLPDMDPVLDDVSLVDYIKRLASDALVHFYPMGAATKGQQGEEMSEIRLLADAGAKAFTDGARAIADASMMRRLLTYATACDAPIIQHIEEPSLAAGGCMNEGEVSTRLGLPGIPREAEVMLLERDLRLVRLTGGRYHAGQVSTRAAVEAIRAAKADGLPVTCGTAPHYFALNELAVHEYRTFAKTSPPLREEDDRRAVTEGLADGTIDVIVSAHNPQGEEEKRQPFELAADGVIGLETLLPIGLDLVHGGHLKMLDLIAAMSLKPATILGLPCGCLKKGAPADLVLFDPEKPWRIEPEKFHSKAKNSAFENRPTQGRVLRTVVGGRTVFGDTSD